MASWHRAGLKLWREDMGPRVCAQFQRSQNAPHSFIDLPRDVFPREWSTHYMFPLQNLPTGGQKAVLREKEVSDISEQEEPMPLGLANCLPHLPRTSAS